MNKDVIYYPEKAATSAVAQFKTPFFLYEEKKLRENCQNFKGAFEKYFPDCELLYAVKANSNPDVLKIVIDEGFKFDASSRSEAWIGKKLGASGMYTGNYTPADDLKHAADCGFVLNLDDVSMIPFLDEIGVPEKLSFRINPGVDKDIAIEHVTAGPDAKYGVPFEKAVEAYRLALKKGVKHFGIHIMTGSNVPVEEKEYFGSIVRKLFGVIAAIKKDTGIEIEFMNIGGGFGVPYHPDKESLDMDEIAKSVRKVFDEQCEKYELKEPRLMAEPGRYISANAGWLVSKVTVIKDSYKKFVGIDASSNDMPRPSVYDAYHYVSVLNDSDERETVSVVGSLCENNDQFAKDRELPICEVGDTVLIHNCGAHAYAMGHNYNGKLRHAEYLYTLEGELRKIREGERIEDLYQGTNI